MVTQVVQDAIIDTVGLDAFFRRYSKFLRDKPKMTPQVLTICVHCLAFICVASTLDIWVPIIKHEIMTSIVANITANTFGDGSAGSLVLSTSAPFMFQYVV